MEGQVKWRYSIDEVRDAWTKLCEKFGVNPDGGRVVAFPPDDPDVVAYSQLYREKLP